MPERSSELRRFPRLPSRCRVWVRDRYGTWDGWTEDISARGCRIVSPRPLTVGTLVRLTLTDDRVAEPLIVSGQVAWVAAGAPARAGISFTGSPAGVPGAGPWVRSLEAAGTVPPAPAGGLEIVVAPPEPEDASPAALATRLADRAEELTRAGHARAAEVLLQRARALAPDDARVRALLAAAGHDPA